MIPAMPPLVFSAWVAAALLWLFVSRGPPKGPSTQEVQLAFPFYHQDAPA